MRPEIVEESVIIVEGGRHILQVPEPCLEPYLYGSLAVV